MKVSGRVVTLLPYSEHRHKMLLQVLAEIDEYIEKNPDVKFNEVDRDLRAKWWKRKGDILWECDEPLDIAFYKSEHFESSQLKKAQDFFLYNALFL